MNLKEILSGNPFALDVARLALAKITCINFCALPDQQLDTLIVDVILIGVSPGGDTRDNCKVGDTLPGKAAFCIRIRCLHPFLARADYSSFSDDCGVSHRVSVTQNTSLDLRGHISWMRKDHASSQKKRNQKQKSFHLKAMTQIRSRRIY